MKIYTDKIEYNDLYEASQLALVGLERCNTVDGRRRKFTHDIILSGESGRSMNSGRYGSATWGAEAATWDQWGIFLAHLYTVDPDARMGGFKYPYYKDADHFHYVTSGRFDAHLADTRLADSIVSSTSSPDYKITAHRWEYDYEKSSPVSGKRVLTCKGHRSVDKGGKNKRAECHAALNRG